MTSDVPARIRRWAQDVLDARDSGRRLAPITDSEELTIEDGYAVQFEVTRLRRARGERLAGWKLGYTSAAMQQQMGIYEPNFGPVFDGMVLRSGAVVGPGLTQPMVESEIGLLFHEPVPPHADRDDVEKRCSAHGALEIVDPVWENYRFTLPDNTADGSSAMRVVLGDPLPAPDLREVAVTLRVNGEAVADGLGANAGGDPLAVAAWLANCLAAHGETLEEGMLVITGGLTAAVPLGMGDEVTAVFDNTVEVGVRRMGA